MHSSFPFSFLFFLLVQTGFPQSSVIGEQHPSSHVISPLGSLSEIDSAVGEAIAAGNVPGAVILVGHRGRIVFEKAYGSRSLQPEVEVMTSDTIFDLASLTKVVVTAPSILILQELGKLRLDDAVARYLPRFAARGKAKITLRDLLTHYSGLPATLRLPRKRKYTAKAILAKIYQTKPVAPPGQRFIYSDLGFVVLGKVVEVVSDKSLALFSLDNIFTPLKMTKTCFLPGHEDKTLIAPTEKRSDAEVIRGQVHDLMAARLGGVAGHAGLFSTASDLAKFCQMFLSQGVLDGKRVLKADTVLKMTSPQSPPEKENIRGYGWDLQSIYSSIKGSYFSARSYGHTGFTGTSIWIDPATESFLIILTNRVHPDGRGDVKDLRIRVADIVGGAVLASAEESARPAGAPLGQETVH